jgi:hypothetical protein
MRDVGKWRNERAFEATCAVGVRDAIRDAAARFRWTEDDDGA